MDKALKQRLVGASVLVALAVIVLPMLLGGQPDSAGESRSIDLPPKPQELSFETRRFPIGDQDSGQPSVLERPARQDRLPAPLEETDSTPVPGDDDAPAEADLETASEPGPAAAADRGKSQEPADQPHRGRNAICHIQHCPSEPHAGGARTMRSAMRQDPGEAASVWVMKVRKHAMVNYYPIFYDDCKWSLSHVKCGDIVPE